MTPLKPWTKKAFELIFHAEHHFRRGDDYDKRLALISFDNSIEVSISIYLSLHPTQRNNKSYPKKDVETWLHNYHSKLGFYYEEINQLGISLVKDKPEVVYLHSQRNELYHGSTHGVPALDTLQDIRAVALWVYSVLFEDQDVEERLNDSINTAKENEPAMPPGIIIAPTSDDIQRKTFTIEKEQTLLAAALLAKWDEGNSADMEIIKRLVDGI